VNEPGVTMDSGHPIQGAAVPPADPPGHGPSPTAQGVRGYRDLPPEDVELINSIKQLEEQVGRVWAAVCARPKVDARKASRARDFFEDGFSKLVGAVAQPHDPYMSALHDLRSTMDQNLAQRSHDHRPDEGSRA
jgi:hypothetical protein